MQLQSFEKHVILQSSDLIFFGYIPSRLLSDQKVEKKLSIFLSFLGTCHTTIFEKLIIHLKGRDTTGTPTAIYFYHQIPKFTRVAVFEHKIQAFNKS